MAQVLQAALRYAGSICAVVTVADDGGSSGRLVPHLDIPPPGDIRRCLLALTPPESPWRDVFEYRFDDADVSGHSLGNLVIAALADLEEDFEAGLARAQDLLGSAGAVIPVAPAHLRLSAEIDGELVQGQHRISHTHGRISAMQVLPEEVRASPRAVAAVMAADQIIVGPGSLYTSVIATLLVPGIAEAVNRSDAELVYIANLITQDAETLGMDGAAHVAAMLELTEVRTPDAIVAASRPATASPPLEAVRFDPDAMDALGVDLVLAELWDPDAAWPQHDAGKLGEVLAAMAPSQKSFQQPSMGGTP
jgi:uncharacterized cofD-like protein